METTCPHGADGWCDDCWARRYRKQLGEALGRSTVPDDLWDFLVCDGSVEDLRVAPDSWPAFLRAAEAAHNFAVWRGADAPRRADAEGAAKARTVPVSATFIDPDPYEVDRAQVFTAGLAAIAAEEPKVVAFRAEVLGGRVRSAADARAFLASPVAHRVPLYVWRTFSPPVVAADATAVERSAPPPRPAMVGDANPAYVVVEIQPGGHRVTVPREPEATRRVLPLPADRAEPVRYDARTPLDALSQLMPRLARRFPMWDDAALAWFVLTGEAPEVEPLWGQTRHEHGAEGRWERAVVTLHVEPWVRAERVEALYRVAQDAIHPDRSRRRDVGPAAWRFKQDQERAEGQPLSNEELRRRWNAEQPTEETRYRTRSGWGKALRSGEAHAAGAMRPGYLSPSDRRRRLAEAETATPSTTPKLPQSPRTAADGHGRGGGEKVG